MNDESSLPPHFRRNFVALLVDFGFFGLAFSFINPNTVLPAFVRTLTNSDPLVGLVATVMNGSWLLPQLGAAALMGDKPRKQPYLLWATYLGRPVYFLLAIVTWFVLPRHPEVMLAVFFVSIATFASLDSIAAVAWFDILARVMPLSKRSRLLGAGQLINGLLGIGSGAAVGIILDSSRLPYPHNYAVLFGITSVLFLPSLVALTVLREPEGNVQQHHRSWRDFVAQLDAVWRQSPDFRRLVSHRWLVGLLSLSLPFFVLHATEVIGLPEAATGWFVSAQMAGGIVASLAFGWLSEQRGPRIVIRLGSGLVLLVPILALSIHLVHSTTFSWLYLLVYFLIGTTNASALLGTTNYMLEIAPDEQRPLYVGLYNTLHGLLVPASFVGGLILQITSYPVLFALTAVGVAMGVWLSLGLGAPRQENIG